MKEYMFFKNVKKINQSSVNSLTLYEQQKSGSSASRMYAGEVRNVKLN